MKIPFYILSFLLLFALACNSPNNNRDEMHSDTLHNDMMIDNPVDTVGMGNDTLGQGVGKGRDDFGTQNQFL